MTNPRVEILRLSILGVVEHGKVTIIDRDGRPVSQRVNVHKLTEADERAGVAWLWREVAKRMVVSLRARTSERQTDPWRKRAENLAASFRLRRRNPSYRGGHRRFEKYSTTTWDQAAKRMWRQGHNRFRRHDRSGWTLWSHTVSNNQNKRADAWRTRRT